MITPYKNRKIDITKPVEVYRNINNKLLSVRQNGLVIGHSNDITLMDAKFIVRESDRKKVLKEKRKNVHACVKGYIQLSNIIIDYDNKVWYNPYETDKFRICSNNEQIECASFIRIYDDGKMIVKTKEG